MTFREYIRIASSFATNSFESDQLDVNLNWLLKEGICLFKEEFLALIGRRRLKTRIEIDLIVQAIPNNVNDWKKKIGKENYYISNALIFLETIEWIAKTTSEGMDNRKENCNDKLLAYNYNHLFQNLMFDSIVLLNDLKINLRNEQQNDLYGVGKNQKQEVMTIFQYLRQVIFGQVSFHSFIEKENDISVSLIRLAIELRLRRGFGILGKIRKSDESFLPLSVESIIKSVKKFEDQVTLPIPLHIIQRIYGWANIFTHAGIKQYTWLSIKAWIFLKEFLIGIQENGWCVHNGIKMNEATLKAIQNDIQHEIDASKFDLWLIPEVDAIIIK